MRRIRATVAAALSVLVVATGGLAAHAATARWAGSGWDDPIKDGYRTGDADLVVSGVFYYDPDAEPQPPPAVSVDEVVLDVTATGDYELPDGCTVPNGSTTEYGPGTGERFEAPFSKALSFPCNGRYLLTARACTPPGCDDPQPPQEWHDLRATIDIAAPPGPVKGLTAKRGSGRTVVLQWNAIANPDLDFAGYRLERVVGGGRWTEVARTEALSHTDTAPDSGGTLQYRVRGLRRAPGGLTATDAGATTAVSIDVPPVPTTTTAGSSGGPRISPPSISRPGRGSGSGFNSPRLGTPTTFDDGFGEFLPYDDSEPGEEDAVLPDEEGASSILYEEEGAGVLVPVASALVLVMWAVHIRYINRLAKR